MGKLCGSEMQQHLPATPTSQRDGVPGTLGMRGDGQRMRSWIPALTKLRVERKKRHLQQRFSAAQHTGRANTPQNANPEPPRCTKPGPAAPGHPWRDPRTQTPVPSVTPHEGLHRGQERGDKGEPGAGNPAQTRAVVSAFGDDLMLFWNRKRLLGRRHLLLV